MQRTPRRLRRHHLAGCCAGLVACLVGCGGRNDPPPEPAPRLAAVDDPVLAGTIASVTFLAGIEGQEVRGFGLVIGLGENGSGDCPTTIRDHLLEIMSKESQTWSSLEQRKRFSPSKLLESQDTAVVEVSGTVPGGTPASGRFDVVVQAIPGTATRSVTGGLLLPCELRLTDLTGSAEELLGGPVVARAAGPVFVNPFASDAGGAPGGSARRGSVLSGGQTLEEPTIRLLLREPAYPTARRLQRRINERFGQRPPAAEAMSRGYLILHTPPELAKRPQEFTRLATYLYLEDHPAFVEAKLRELARLVVLPNADYERIMLAWEGIGRTAVPSLQPLYTHGKPQVRLAAARAGLRLQDVDALPIVAEIAALAQPALALPAVRELGRCPYPQAAVSLLPLLDGRDRDIRIAAYEALLKHRHPAVRTRQFPHILDRMKLNLALDIVESSGEPLIHVRRARVPRIAVFGPNLPVTIPLFYTDQDDSVTLNATQETGDITMFTTRAGRLSDPLHVPPRVVDLISALADLPVKDDSGRVRGLGLPYSQVVHVLSVLCDNGTIPAHLEVERISLAETLGPETLPERPEGDVPPVPEAPTDRPDREDSPTP